MNPPIVEEEGAASQWEIMKTKINQLEQAVHHKSVKLDEMERSMKLKSQDFEFEFEQARFDERTLVFARYCHENEIPSDYYEHLENPDEVWASKVLGDVPVLCETLEGADFVSHLEKWVQQHSKSSANLSSDIVYCPKQVQYGLVKRVLKKAFVSDADSSSGSDSDSKKRKLKHKKKKSKVLTLKQRILSLGFVKSKDPNTYTLKNLELAIRTLEKSSLKILSESILDFQNNGVKFTSESWESGFLRILSLAKQAGRPFYENADNFAKLAAEFQGLTFRMCLSEEQTQAIVNKYSTTTPSLTQMKAYFRRMDLLTIPRGKAMDPGENMKRLEGKGFVQKTGTESGDPLICPVAEEEWDDQGIYWFHAKGKGKKKGFGFSSGFGNAGKGISCDWCAGPHPLRECRSYDLARSHARQQGQDIPKPANKRGIDPKGKGKKEGKPYKGWGKGKGKKSKARFVYWVDEQGGEHWDQEEDEDHEGGEHGEGEQEEEKPNEKSENNDNSEYEHASAVNEWIFNEYDMNQEQSPWITGYNVSTGQNDCESNNIFNVQQELTKVLGTPVTVKPSPQHSLPVVALTKEEDEEKALPVALYDDGCSTHLFGSNVTACEIEKAYADKGIPTRRIPCQIPCNTAAGPSHCRWCLIFPIVFGLVMCMSIMVVTAFEGAPLLFGERMQKVLETTRVNTKQKSVVTSAIEGHKSKYESTGAGLYLDILNPVINSPREAIELANAELRKIKTNTSVERAKANISHQSNKVFLDNPWTAAEIPQELVVPRRSGRYLSVDPDTNDELMKWSNGKTMWVFRSVLHEKTLRPRMERATGMKLERMEVDWCTGKILSKLEQPKDSNWQGRVIDSVLISKDNISNVTMKMRIQRLWRKEMIDVSTNIQVIAEAAILHNQKVKKENVSFTQTKSLSGYDQSIRSAVKDHWATGGKVTVWRGQGQELESQIEKMNPSRRIIAVDTQSGHTVGGLWDQDMNTKKISAAVHAGMLKNEMDKNEWTDVISFDEGLVTNHAHPTNEISLIRQEEQNQSWTARFTEAIMKLKPTKWRASRDRSWIGAIPLLKRSKPMKDDQRMAILESGILENVTYEQFNGDHIAMALKEALEENKNSTAPSSSAPRAENNQTGVESESMLTGAEQRKLDDEVRKLINQLASGLGYPPMNYLEQQALEILGIKSDTAKAKLKSIIKRVTDSRLFGLPYQRLPGSKIGSIYGTSAQNVLLVDTFFVTDDSGASRAILVGVVAGTRFSFTQVLGGRTKKDMKILNETKSSESSPTKLEVAAFVTSIVESGAQIKTIIFDKGAEFRNRLVINRCSAHGIIPRYGGKGSVGKTSMVERVVLTLKTLRDRMMQHDVWRLLEQTDNSSFWKHINLARNMTKSSVLKGLSPWEAQKLEPPPLLKKSPEEFGDQDDSAILEDWRKFRLLEIEREKLIDSSNYLVALRKIGERIHRNISLKRSYRAGDNVEVKLKNGRWVKMIVLAKRDSGTSTFYEVRSYLGTRVSDVPSRHMRPAISAAEFLDLPDAEIIKNAENMSDKQLMEYEGLEEGPVIGDQKYEMLATEIPTETWPRCKKCGKERRILHTETLPKEWECSQVEGFCSLPDDKTSLRLGFGVRPRRWVARGRKAKTEAPSKSGQDLNDGLELPVEEKDEPRISDDDDSDVEISPSDDENLNEEVDKGEEQPALTENVDFVVNKMGLVGMNKTMQPFFEASMRVTDMEDAGECDGEEVFVKVVKMYRREDGAPTQVPAGESRRREGEWLRRIAISRREKVNPVSTLLEVRETQGLYKLIRGVNKSFDKGQDLWSPLSAACGNPEKMNHARVKSSGTRVKLSENEIRTGEAVVVSAKSGLRAASIEIDGGLTYTTKSKDEIVIVFSQTQSATILPESELGKVGPSVDDDVIVRLCNLPAYITTKAAREGKFPDVPREILWEAGYSKFAIRSEKKELHGLLKIQPITGVPVGKITSKEREAQCKSMGSKSMKSKFLFDLKKVRLVREGGEEYYVAELKARLVPGGYEQTWSAEYGSSTVSADVMRMMLCKAAEMDCPYLLVGDVARAFNLSTPLQADKRSCIAYPKNCPEGELDQDMSIKGDHDWNSKLPMEVYVPLYGMRNASSAFAKTLETYLLARNFTNTEVCPCLFKHTQKELWIIAHVDDLMILSSDIKAIREVITEIEARFPVKEWSNVHAGEIEFCGKQISLERNQSGKYVLKVRIGGKTGGLVDMEFPAETDDSRQLNPEELKLWQSNYGSMLWLSQFRMDLAYMLRYCSPHRTVKEARRINQAIHYLGGRSAEVAAHECGGKRYKWLIHSDASMQLQDLICNKSLEIEASKPIGGFVAGFIQEEVDVTKDPYFCWRIVSFNSFRVQRRVFSSYSAEIEALVECLNRLEYLQCIASQFFSYNMNVEIGSDSLSLIRRINSRSGIKPKDSENIGALLRLKEEFRNRRYALRFLSDGDNCADLMTKIGSGRKLGTMKELISSGYYSKEFDKNVNIDKVTGSSRIQFKPDHTSDPSCTLVWNEDRDSQEWQHYMWEVKDISPLDKLILNC